MRFIYLYIIGVAFLKQSMCSRQFNPSNEKEILSPRYSFKSKNFKSVSNFSAYKPRVYDNLYRNGVQRKRHIDASTFSVQQNSSPLSKQTAIKQVGKKNIGKPEVSNKTEDNNFLNTTQDSFNHSYPNYIEQDTSKNKFRESQGKTQSYDSPPLPTKLEKFSPSLDTGKDDHSWISTIQRHVEQILKNEAVLPSNYSSELQHQNDSLNLFRMLIIPKGNFTTISKSNSKRDTEKDVTDDPEISSDKPVYFTLQKKELLLTPKRTNHEAKVKARLKSDECSSAVCSANCPEFCSSQNKSKLPSHAKSSENITTVTTSENGTSFITNIFNVPLTIFAFLTGK